MKTIALIAHDKKKNEMLEFVGHHLELLKEFHLVATHTTGTLISQTFGLDVETMMSGPLGGDQQIGAAIVEGDIDLLVFFWDPLEPMSHDPDIKALLRLAVLWNIPTACNVATADFIISSPLFASDYQRAVPDFSAYRQRALSLSDNLPPSD